MEYIKKEDLIDGEIYVYQDIYINKITKLKLAEIDCWVSKNTNSYHEPIPTGYFNSTTIIRLATSEEKHWLNTCIQQNKFITFEEAMKTFIPEYVECTKDQTASYKKSKIYKVNTSNKECGRVENNNGGMAFYQMNLHRFKPSTKEAYDAQFVVKEPEPLPQFKVIETIETITKVENNEGNQFFIGDKITIISGSLPYTIKGFKCYSDNMVVLIDNNELDINDIEHYIEPKTNYQILEYKTESGISCKAPFLADFHQFYMNEKCKIYSIKRISDDLIITVGDEVLSKTCNVPNKILSIELINNKIRLYPRNSFYNLEDIVKVEIKEETLLEKAKRLYPVGTKFNNYKIAKCADRTVEVLTTNIIKRI